MAVSEMDYMNIGGGGRTPIKIASITTTSSQTIVDAISALKTSAGDKLTQALANNWNTLCFRITTTQGVGYIFICNTYIPSYNVFFTCSYINSAGTTISVRDIYIDLTSTNDHKMRIGGTTTSGTSLSSQSTVGSYAGTWELYY